MISLSVGLYLRTVLHNGYDPSDPETLQIAPTLEIPRAGGNVPAAMWEPQESAAVRRQIWDAAMQYSCSICEEASLRADTWRRRLCELAVQYPDSTAEAWHWALSWGDDPEIWHMLPPPYCLLPWKDSGNAALFKPLAPALLELLKAKYHADNGDLIETATGRALDPVQTIRLKHRVLTARQAYLNLTNGRLGIRAEETPAKVVKTKPANRPLHAVRRDYPEDVVAELRRKYKPDHANKSITRISTDRAVPALSPIKIRGVSMRTTQAYLQLVPDAELLPMPEETASPDTPVDLPLPLAPIPEAPLEPWGEAFMDRLTEIISPADRLTAHDLLRYQLRLATRPRAVPFREFTGLGPDAEQMLVMAVRTAHEPRDNTSQLMLAAKLKREAEARMRLREVRKAIWVPFHECRLAPPVLPDDFV